MKTIVLLLSLISLVHAQDINLLEKAFEKQENQELLNNQEEEALNNLASWTGQSSDYVIDTFDIHNLDRKKDFREDINLTRLVLIKKGKILFNLDSAKAVRVPRDIYVHLYRKDNRNPFNFVLNKEGKVQYAISVEDIIDINKVVDLKTKPDSFETYSPPDKATFSQDSIELVNLISLSLGSFNTDYLREYLDTPEQGLSNTLGLQLSSYLRWDFPVEAGLRLNYERGFVDYDDSRNYYTYQLGIGPSFRYVYGNYEQFTISLFFNPQKIFLHYTRPVSSTSEEDKIVFNSNAVELGIEAHTPLKLGSFVFGLVFRRQWVSFKKEDNLALEDRDLLIESYKNTSYSLQGFIGYEFRNIF